MAGLITELIGILDSQAENYENLLALSLEKKDAIIANDVESLQKITFLENTLVNRNQKLEKSRLVIVKDIANVLNRREADLTLSALADLTKGQPEYDDLVKAAERIKSAISNLSETNRLNSSLIQNALEYIDFTINLLKSTMETDMPGYTRSGGESGVTGKGYDKRQ